MRMPAKPSLERCSAGRLSSTFEAAQQLTTDVSAAMAAAVPARISPARLARQKLKRVGPLRN